MAVAIVIPARFGSSRFPGKPLVSLNGAEGKRKPLVQWTHEAARQVVGAGAVYVATDDPRIADCVASFGGNVLMTPTSCANGTERVAACLDQIPDAELIINFQGDALLTPPPFVDALIAHMAADADATVGTVAVRCSPETYRLLAEDEAQGRAGGTTVVLDTAGRALYFSKRILPYIVPGTSPGRDRPVLLHLGLYAYRRAALERYMQSGPAMLEMAEGLEQLRFLVNGVPISVLVQSESAFPMVEVNNPSDVPIVEGILRGRKSQ